jgi:hypothetical protein
LEKIFNMPDNGVTEDFLYSKDYAKLIKDSEDNIKTEFEKLSPEKIPILPAMDKNLTNFDTQEIPKELLDYKRSEANRHIPTIISGEDFREMARRAVIQNNLPLLRGIINEIRDPDFFVDDSRTILQLAVENNNYALVRYLLYDGASVNMSDQYLNTPLHLAVANDNEEVIELLLENGANIDSQNLFGDTPLMWAISKNKENAFYTLIKNGAKVEILNEEKETAYALSIKYARKRMRQHLANILTSTVETLSDDL